METGSKFFNVFFVFSSPVPEVSVALVPVWISENGIKTRIVPIAAIARVTGIGIPACVLVGIWLNVASICSCFT